MALRHAAHCVDLVLREHLLWRCEAVFIRAMLIIVRPVTALARDIPFLKGRRPSGLEVGNRQFFGLERNMARQAAILDGLRRLRNGFLCLGRCRGRRPDARDHGETRTDTP